MRRILLPGAVLALIVAGYIFLNFAFHKPVDQPNIWSEKNIIKIITDKRSSFMPNGSPVIKVTDISILNDGWGIATIQSTHSKRDTSFVKVLLLEKDRKLNLILGPDTHFTDTELSSHNIPDSVILELEKS